MNRMNQQNRSIGIGLGPHISASPNKTNFSVGKFVDHWEIRLVLSARSVQAIKRTSKDFGNELTHARQVYPIAQFDSPLSLKIYTRK